MTRVLPQQFVDRVTLESGREARSAIGSRRPRCSSTTCSAWRCASMRLPRGDLEPGRSSLHGHRPGVAVNMSGEDAYPRFSPTEMGLSWHADRGRWSAQASTRTSSRPSRSGRRRAVAHELVGHPRGRGALGAWSTAAALRPGRGRRRQRGARAQGLRGLLESRLDARVAVARTRGRRPGRLRLGVVGPHSASSSRPPRRSANGSTPTREASRCSAVRRDRVVACVG